MYFQAFKNANLQNQVKILKKTTCKVAKNSSCRDAEIFIKSKNAKNEAK